MKVFDFTNGTKGKLLATVNRVNSNGSSWVRKGDKVYSIELVDAPRGWGWHDGATVPKYTANGKWDGEEAITPEQFGVGAICFCWGQNRSDQVWKWVVLGTCEWNRAAVKSGILKSTFHHISKPEDRAESVAFMVLHLREELREADLLARCAAAEIEPDMVRALMADPAAVARIMDH